MYTYVIIKILKYNIAYFWSRYSTASSELCSIAMCNGVFPQESLKFKSIEKNKILKKQLFFLIIYFVDIFALELSKNTTGGYMNQLKLVDIFFFIVHQ